VSARPAIASPGEEELPVTPRTSPVLTGRPSFLAAPRCADLDLLDADIAVLGLPYTTPCDLASSRGPSSEAPGAVREQSQQLAGRSTHYDFDFGGDLFAGRRVRIVDCGDARAAAGRYEENACNATAVVRAVLERSRLVIVIGGDHAATLPAARACAGQGPLCVVHLGADLDWRDEVDGVRDGAPSAMRRVAELPGVSAMMQVGLRGSGSARPSDVEDARAFGSVLVRAEEVHELGVPEILRRVPAAPRYYVSLDATALDPSIAPGVEAPAFGGLTYYEATNLLKGIAARGPVVGMDLVGIAPAKDLHGRTSLLGARLVLNLVGALAHAGRIGEVLDAGAARRGGSPAPAPARASGSALVGGRR
jgi:agmatinase